MKTKYLTERDVQHQWYVIDAEGKTLGRLSTKVADLLRGKNKPEFQPDQFIGDFVIIVNAEKIQITGRKAIQKMYYRHSGYPGGLKSINYQKLLEKKPEQILEHAIKGMLPKNRLAKRLLSNLKIYSGPEHPHKAQQPIAI